ncbi:MAG: ABC transporter ATP-binding protein [Planctomycetota bacterium]|nr:ABC transporter ATP-binding protein [Planctomycetota bacterium]
MIDVRNLVKEYRGGDGASIRAVDGVSFTVAPGEMVGLLGGNGAGKTTTMRVIATLLAPTAGTVMVAGRDVRDDPIGVRRQLGYVSAATGVPDRLTPGEVLDSHGRIHGLGPHARRARVADLAEALDLTGYLDRPCGRLSSGQRQRVSLGRALVHDPPVLVLDEPTSALDILGARDLFDLLERLRRQGRTILVSTHRLHEIERRCDRFLIIDAGRIVADGTRDDLVRGDARGLEEAFFAAVAPARPA